jgi:hypothetical protein
MEEFILVIPYLCAVYFQQVHLFLLPFFQTEFGEFNYVHV